jgi:elongation factor G
MNPRAGRALLSLALDPRTADDARRLAHGLQKLMAEDPGLRIQPGQPGGHVVIGCAGEQHLDIVIDRLKREFAVEASVGRPEIAYREALTQSGAGEMKYAWQAGDRGHYAHVKLRLYPGEPGTGYIFENNVTGGAIPSEFIKAVDDGIQDALSRGVVGGYPIEDVRIDLYDGSYHDTDSSETAFTLAGSLAAQDAARKGAPVLLEPIMRVETVVPSESLADVMKNIVGRRGQFQSRRDSGDTHVILALVPLAELFGYATDLRLRTRGRGTYVMAFERYEPFQAGDDEDDRDSLVGAPRRPSLTPQNPVWPCRSLKTAPGTIAANSAHQ